MAAGKWLTLYSFNSRTSNNVVSAFRSLSRATDKSSVEICEISVNFFRIVQQTVGNILDQDSLQFTCLLQAPDAENKLCLPINNFKANLNERFLK